MDAGMVMAIKCGLDDDVVLSYFCLDPLRFSGKGWCFVMVRRAMRPSITCERKHFAVCQNLVFMHRQ